jgi:hypothetical protein
MNGARRMQFNLLPRLHTNEKTIDKNYVEFDVFVYTFKCESEFFYSLFMIMAHFSCFIHNFYSRVTSKKWFVNKKIDVICELTH